MTTEMVETDSREEILRSPRRSLQFWSVLVLGLGLVGVGLALYGLLVAPSEAWSPAGVARLVPPLLYGVLAFIVLMNYTVARKEAVIRGLQEELIQQKIEAELNRELALLDPVTEVYNRRYLRIIISKEISRTKRYGKGLSVMMVDITGFRRVNESLGQMGGDVVLKQIAHLIQVGIRNSDYIVRFGGDEFLVVLPDTDDANVALLAGRLKEAFREWARRSGMTEFNLRFAIGIARYVPDRPIDEILKLAEQRMNADKQRAETPEKQAEATPASAPAKKTAP
jgi:diguanylate cyclase (GGDEF)-like protein